MNLGEEYFIQKGGNYVLYFTALMLTGQLEQAIGALYRGDMLVHAVHIAILAYQFRLLVLADKVDAEIRKLIRSE